MAKRNLIQGNSELDEVKDSPIQVIEFPELSGRTALVLLMDLKLKIRGPVSGEDYFFDGAGSVLMVNDADLERMLAKTMSVSTCCGSSAD